MSLAQFFQSIRLRLGCCSLLCFELRQQSLRVSQQHPALFFGQLAATPPVPNFATPRALALPYRLAKQVEPSTNN